MSPVTRLAQLLGRFLLCVLMANFSPVARDEIQETKSRCCHIKLHRSRLSWPC